MNTVTINQIDRKSRMQTATPGQPGQRKRTGLQENISDFASKLHDRRSNQLAADELDSQPKEANRSFQQAHTRSIGFQTRATSQHQQRKDAFWSSNNVMAYRIDAGPPKPAMSDNSHKYIFDKNYTQHVKSTQKNYTNKILSPDHQRFQGMSTNQTSSVPNGLSKRIRSAVKYQTATSKDLFAFQR